MITIGRSASRLIDEELCICVMYNLACAYQGYPLPIFRLWTLQKCKKYCEHATE